MAKWKNTGSFITRNAHAHVMPRAILLYSDAPRIDSRQSPRIYACQSPRIDSSQSPRIDASHSPRIDSSQSYPWGLGRRRSVETGRSRSVVISHSYIPESIRGDLRGVDPWRFGTLTSDIQATRDRVAWNAKRYTAFLSVTPHS